MKCQKTIIAVVTLFFSFLTFSQVDIDSAYKREYIFLTSQIKELKNQRTKIEANYKKVISDAKKNLAQDQKKIVILNAKNEKNSEILYNLEQNLESLLVNKSTLENTAKQAMHSLNIKDKTKAEDINFLFNKNLNQLNSSSHLKNEIGHFFLKDGKQVKGDLIHIGKIAMYGHHNGKYYLLAPAGGGALKVWKELVNGKQIYQGQLPDILPLFIFENLDRAVSKKESQSIIKFIKSGGTIAWIIVMMGVIALALCIIRAIHLKLYSRDTDFIEKNTHNSNLNSTMEALNNYNSRYEPKNIFLNIIRNKDQDKETINDIIDEGMIHEHKLIDRFGAIILVFAAVAPLMGLLGTVTGMISTFDIITEHGTGDPKLLSQGISEALITTELGLIVAIPTLLFGNILSGQGKNIKMTLDKLVLKLVNNL